MSHTGELLVDREEGACEVCGRVLTKTHGLIYFIRPNWKQAYAKASLPVIWELVGQRITHYIDYFKLCITVVQISVKIIPMDMQSWPRISYKAPTSNKEL